MAKRKTRHKRTLFHAIAVYFLASMGILIISVILFYSSFQSIVESSNNVFQRFISKNSIHTELNEMMNLLVSSDELGDSAAYEVQFAEHMVNIKTRLIVLQEGSLDPQIFYRFTDLSNMLENLNRQAVLHFADVQKGATQGYLDISITNILRMRELIELEMADVLMEDVFTAESYFRRRVQAYETLRVLFVIGMFVILIFCIIFLSRMTKRAIGPIRYLQEEIAKARDGVPTPVDVDSHGIIEVETLISYFNQMAKQTIQYVDQIEKNAQVEIKLRQQELKNLEYQHLLIETEYRFLQAQINPHFLFNAINSGIALAAMEHAPRAKDLLSNFAGYLRYNIGKHGEMVRLEDEINVAKAYIRIQNIRYDDRIDYSCDISEDTKDLLIPYMIVLPLVENAILHGLAEKDEHAMLLLDASVNSQFLVLTIADNGVGMTEEKIQSILQESEAKGTGNSIGIGNVKRRLELLYGENCLMISSKLGIGTKMIIQIPINQNQQGIKGESNDV